MMKPWSDDGVVVDIIGDVIDDSSDDYGADNIDDDDDNNNNNDDIDSGDDGDEDDIDNDCMIKVLVKRVKMFWDFVCKIVQQNT